MHIPWGWIKQRPHFIAEHLSKDFDVTVKYRHSNRVNQKNLVNKKPLLVNNLSISGYRIITFDKIPVVNKFNFEWLNKLLFKFYINNINKYDYIWITSPLIYQYLSIKKMNIKVIYDCMDDFLEFSSVKDYKKIENIFFNLEKEIIEKVEIVICSSKYLLNILKKRYNTERRIYLINNAMSLSAFNNNIQFKNNKLFKKIVKFENPFIYVGTISEWFDFDSILTLLNNIKNINVLLYGPIRNIKVPAHKQLHIMGTIDHKYIYEIMKCAKALIMPFKVNKLILSVNPVKMYEYIYSGKPIIATKYAETENFKNYIYLYVNAEELIQISDSIINNIAKKFDENLMKNFALRNTWENRYNSIRELL